MTKSEIYGQVSKDEFKSWMDARGLKASQVAHDLGVDEATVRNWRSQGVPKRRRPHVERYMAAWVDPASTQDSSDMNILRIEFTDEEIDLVNQAARIAGCTDRDFVRRTVVHQARAIKNKN